MTCASRFPVAVISLLVSISVSVSLSIDYAGFDSVKSCWQRSSEQVGIDSNWNAPLVEGFGGIAGLWPPCGRVGRQREKGLSTLQWNRPSRATKVEGSASLRGGGGGPTNATPATINSLSHVFIRKFISTTGTYVPEFKHSVSQR